MPLGVLGVLGGRQAQRRGSPRRCPLRTVATPATNSATSLSSHYVRRTDRRDRGGTRNIRRGRGLLVCSSVRLRNWDAKAAYHHFQCAPGLLWLGEALGEDPDVLGDAVLEVKPLRPEPLRHALQSGASSRGAGSSSLYASGSPCASAASARGAEDGTVPTATAALGTELFTRAGRLAFCSGGVA